MRTCACPSAVLLHYPISYPLYPNEDHTSNRFLFQASISGIDNHHSNKPSKEWWEPDGKNLWNTRYLPEDTGEESLRKTPLQANRRKIYEWKRHHRLPPLPRHKANVPIYRIYLPARHFFSVDSHPGSALICPIGHKPDKQAHSQEVLFQCNGYAHHIYTDKRIYSDYPY